LTFDPYKSVIEMGDTATLDSWFRYANSLPESYGVYLPPIPWLAHTGRFTSPEGWYEQAAFTDSIETMSKIYEDSVRSVFESHRINIDVQRARYTAPSSYRKGGPTGETGRFLLYLLNDPAVQAMGQDVIAALVSQGLIEAAKLSFRYMTAVNVPPEEMKLGDHHPVAVKGFCLEHARTYHSEKGPKFAQLVSWPTLDPDYPYSNDPCVISIPCTRGALIYTTGADLRIRSIAWSSSKDVENLETDSWFEMLEWPM
jgi:hypothetical protein